MEWAVLLCFKSNILLFFRLVFLICLFPFDFLFAYFRKLFSFAFFRLPQISSRFSVKLQLRSTRGTLCYLLVTDQTAGSHRRILPRSDRETSPPRHRTLQQLANNGQRRRDPGMEDGRANRLGSNAVIETSSLRIFLLFDFPYS